MARKLKIKDHAAETRLFANRAIVAMVLVIILMLVIVARLFYLQVVNHEHFSTASRNNRIKIVPVPPTRGLIYDRNGVLLAENIPSFSLELVAEQINDMDDTLNRLKSLISISESDLTIFKRLLKQKRTRRFESLPLRFRLSEEEVARFAVNRHLFPGVDIQARLIRSYPFGDLGVHVLGYVGRINIKELKRIDPANYSATTHIGKLGIERAYEELLHGEVGYRQEEVNVQGRTLRVLNKQPPVAGNNIFLNIDIKLQQVVTDALGEFRGSAVAIDPRNGEILAMVSKPGYDPNLFVTGIDSKSYAELRDSKDKPLFNRTLLGQYPPGSTVKPFMGLAGLEAGKITEDVFCPGWYTLKGDDHRYRDWKKVGHGVTDLDKAITESCDVYFYELAHRLRIDSIHDFMSKFGFGQRTGIDVIGELAGLMPSREWKRRERRLPWYPGETLITGIGQGFTLTTPIQLASATATLAMQGKRIKPSLLHATQSAGEQAMQYHQTELLEPIQLKHTRHWAEVTQAMRNVVHGSHGTARGSARGAKYKYAGKTGTAQVFGIAQDAEYEEDKVAAKLRDHSLFISFAPIDKPRIAVAVVAENAGSGSRYAAPIARKIMDAYLLKDKP